MLLPQPLSHLIFYDQALIFCALTHGLGFELEMAPIHIWQSKGCVLLECRSQLVCLHVRFSVIWIFVKDKFTSIFGALCNHACQRG